MLQVKLAHLAAWTDARRRRLADHYGQRFEADGVRTVPWHDGDVHHLLVIRLAGGARDGRPRCPRRQGDPDRDPLPDRAVRAAVACGPTSGRARTPSSPGRELLSLPMDPLMTHDEVDRVCDAVAALVTA